jgi:hypothetical protein
LPADKTVFVYKEIDKSVSKKDLATFPTQFPADKPYNEETGYLQFPARHQRQVYSRNCCAGIRRMTRRTRTDKHFEETILERNCEYAGKKAGRAYLDIVEQIEALSSVKHSMLTPNGNQFNLTVVAVKAMLNHPVKRKCRK